MMSDKAKESLEKLIEDVVALRMKTPNQLLGLFADGIYDLLHCSVTEEGFLEVEDYRKQVSEGSPIGFAFLLLDSYKKYVDSNFHSKTPNTQVFDVDKWQLPTTKDIGGEEINHDVNNQHSNFTVASNSNCLSSTSPHAQ